MKKYPQNNRHFEKKINGGTISMCQYHFNRNIKSATQYTIERNRNFALNMGLDQKHCFHDEYRLAEEKCIYPAKHMVLHGEDGHVVWDLKAFSFFEQDEAPDTVNPSLWLNGKGNYCAGVFEVVKDAIYQVRGFDIANLTIIRSKTGWIVQDVMSTIETSHAALELLEKALNEKVISKIRAVIISHSHGDHFGGIRGVVKPEQVGAASEGKIPIYVPAGFDIECVKENLFAGTAMGRRANHQFGMDINPGTQGLVSTGLGLASPKGIVSFVTPTDYIEKDKTIVIDGITVEFQLTPGTEAPSEMNNYFADYRALWMAENCCGTLHNLYPIRGAQLRDSNAWADYILEAMEKYADKSDVVFQSHNWPHFNTPEHPNAVREYLLNNAAIYKYTHDQTLLLANQGYTAKDIATKLEIPEGLKFNWYARPYYGSLPINARAVYTKYLGFYNGNPNDIDPLTEVEEAKAFVEYAGSEESILEKAVKDFEAGDYRKTAFAAGKVVLANQKNEKARQLCADAFEQLGYVSESSIWRNAYLQGAFELREGVNPNRKKLKKSADMAKCMSVDLLLKYIGILFDNDKAQKEEFQFTLNIVDSMNDKNTGKKISYLGKETILEERYTVCIHSGVVLHYPVNETQTEGYVTTTKTALFALLERNIEKARKLIDTNCFEYLETLQKYMVDLSETADFPMVEAIE